MKIGAPCSKMMKNLKIVRAEHPIKYGNMSAGACVTAQVTPPRRQPWLKRCEELLSQILLCCTLLFSVDFPSAKTAYLAKQLKHNMNISRVLETFSKCSKIMSLIGII